MKGRVTTPGTPLPFVDGSEACAGADTSLFFGRSTSQAKAVCEGCPLVEGCRDYALTATGVAGIPIDGVWGGTTRHERAAVRRALGLRLAAGVTG